MQMVSDAIDLNAVRRVLVTKLRHHGDVLLTSPVFQVLRNHAPHVEIDALVYRDTADMLTLHPAITQVHTIDRQWKRLGPRAQLAAEWTLFKTLRERSYDLLIHLTEHPRGAWLARLLQPRFAVGRRLPDRGAVRDRVWRRSFSHLYVFPRATQRHAVELNLDALRRIGIYPDAAERKLVLAPGDDAEAHADRLLAQHGLTAKGFIHLHPTSRWLFKCWTEQNMTARIAQLQQRGETVVVTAAPDERERAMVRAILAPLAQPAIDFSGQLSLKQLAALTARARLFIGVDSAPMHIAAAVQTPVVALFGPSGEIEWGPWQVAHQVITSDHPCRPCGNDGCGGGKVSECLTTLPVARVMAAAIGLLDRA